MVSLRRRKKPSLPGLVLIGDGAHAADIKADLPGFNVMHFMHSSSFRATLVTANYGRPDCPILIAVNDPQLRAKIAAELGCDDQGWVHSQARLNHDVWYAKGVHINYGVVAVRANIAEYCTISPGVTICGDVEIGARTLIGAGAVIGDRVTIGSDVTVGMGAVVLPETVIPDGETWVGVPAARIKP